MLISALLREPCVSAVNRILGRVAMSNNAIELVPAGLSFVWSVAAEDVRSGRNAVVARSVATREGGW